LSDAASAGDDHMRLNPSEGGSANTRNKNKKNKKNKVRETPPENEKCRYHDDNSSAPQPAPALRVWLHLD
jgi:hypothetical protein